MPVALRSCAAPGNRRICTSLPLPTSSAYSASVEMIGTFRSCSHPFPFRPLQYKVSNPHRRAMLGGGASPTAEGQSQRRAGASDSPSQPIVEQDGSNRLSSRTKDVRAEPRFPDLSRNPIWKSKTPLISEATVNAGTKPPQSGGVG
jgi:hypothetical protein